MVIVVKTRNPLGPQILSWVVVGIVLGIGLGAAVAFTTSGHPKIADSFYVFSAVLFNVKFFTWEDVRQQEPKLRQRANALAVIITTVVLSLVIAGNHHLNRMDETAAPGSLPQASTVNPQDRNKNEVVPNLVIKSTTPTLANDTPKTSEQIKKKLQPKKEPVPSPQTVNNAPNGIAISGGVVTNPTVNNFVPAQRSLSEHQKTQIATSMSRYAGQVLVIQYAVGHDEQYNYAHDFLDALTRAGWKAQIAAPRDRTEPCGGVELSIPKPDESVKPNDPVSEPIPAQALEDLLTSMGIPVIGRVLVNEVDNSGRFNLIVCGRKQ
jgi:hypothetical protein